MYNNLWELPRNEIAPPTPRHSSYNWIRNVVTAVEVGFDILVGFVPGLDLLDPGVIAIELGLNEAGGGVNYWIDKRQRGVNWFNDIFYFGAPLAGVASAELQNVRRLKKLFGNEIDYEISTKHLDPLTNKWLSEKFNAKFKFEKIESHGSYAKLRRTELGNLKSIINETANARYKNFLNKTVDRRFLTKFGSKSIADINLGSVKFEERINLDLPIIEGSEEIIDRTEETYYAQPRDRKLTNIFVEDLGMSTTEAREIILAIRASPGYTRESMNNITALIYKRIIQGNFGNLETRKILVEMIDTAIRTNAMEDNMSAIIGSIQAWNKRYRIFERQKASKFGIKQNMSFTQKLRTVLTSKHFKHDYVDRLKYINPAMAARKPINYAYRKLEKYFQKWFNRRIYSGSAKVAFDYAKQVASVTDKELKRLITKGEVIGLQSQWLNTLRVLKPSPKINLSVITFKSQPTWGKEPVFIWATVHELKELIESPGSTYDNKFSISRGGKHTGLLGLFGIKGATKIENEIFGKIVNFLPVQAVRNVLSVAGNLKREFPKMKNGTYFNTYIDKYKKSLETYGIGRATRLLSRGVLAPMLTKTGMFDKVVGKIYKTSDIVKIRRETRRLLGMEFQRYTTASLSYGVKNLIKGQSFGKGLRARLKYAATRTVRDQMLHYQREMQHGKIYRGIAVSNVRYQRVGKIYRRIPNTFMTKKFKKRFY